MNTWKIVFTEADNPNSVCCTYLAKCETEEEAKKLAKEYAGNYPIHKERPCELKSCVPYSGQDISWDDMEKVVLISYKETH